MGMFLLRISSRQRLCLMRKEIIEARLRAMPYQAMGYDSRLLALAFS